MLHGYIHGSKSRGVTIVVNQQSVHVLHSRCVKCEVGADDVFHLHHESICLSDVVFILIGKVTREREEERVERNNMI